MAKVTLADVDVGLDGEYDFDPTYFTNRELHIIKRETGLRAGELADAVANGDNDLVIIFAYICLLRHGKQLPNADLLWDAKTGGILLVMDDEDADADPPPDSTTPTDSDNDES